MKTRTLFLFLLVWNSLSVCAQEIAGDWNGVLEVRGTKLTLVFHFNCNNGLYTGTMDSPDQSAKGIPITSVTFKDSLLNVTLTPLQAEYSGKWDGKSLKGTFKQMGMSFPLDLEKGALKRNRPQEPKAPFPYNVEDVTFLNAKDGISLAGTLTFPKGKVNSKYPAVVMITGSGAENRDEEIFDHKPFWIIADYLTRKGIAVLRFDDRGFGKSGGVYKGATSADFAKDVEAAVAYLRTRKDINKKKIGLMGHSEGGIIAPMVASTDKKIAFIVLLAGPGISGEKILIQQGGDLLGESYSEEAKQSLAKIHKGSADILRQFPGESARSQLQKFYKEKEQDICSILKFDTKQGDIFINSMINHFMDPWFRSFLLTNPADYLVKVKCPVLALNGTKDRQVRAEENLDGIMRALNKGGNRNVETTSIYPLNHLFQECKTGMPAEYGAIEETFSPKALDKIWEWYSRKIK